MNSYFRFSNISSYIILFLIWPLLAFIAAIYNYNHKESRKVILIFFIYYGLALIVGKGMDSIRYVETFQSYSNLPFSEILNVLGGSYSNDTSIDIIEPLMSFLISRITTNYRLLFGAYAAIFGFFYLKSITVVYQHYIENKSLNSLIFMVFLIVLLPITSIYNPRMWTAAWIFFFGVYHVVLNRKTIFLFVTMSACLMHWSYISLNLLLLLYVFVGNRNWIYFPLALVSFVVPNLIQPLFKGISSNFGSAIETRYNNYTGEAYTESIQQAASQSSWFMSLNYDLIFFYLVMTVFIVKFLYRKFPESENSKNLYSFILVFLSFVNFGQNIPAFGWRMKMVFLLFSTLYVFLFFTRLPYSKKLNPITIIGLIPMALYAVINFRIGLETVNAWILSPGIGYVFFIKELSIADILF